MPALRYWLEALVWTVVLLTLSALLSPAQAASFLRAETSLERTMEKYLTEEEQRRLLKTLKTAPAEDLVAQRDAAAIRALLRSGCRIGEFLKISMGDALAALRSKRLFIPREHRKGGKRDHTVFVTAELESDLRGLIRVRSLIAPGNALETEPLIVTRRGTVPTVRAFQLVWKKWAIKAGLPECSSPHWARHTRAMNIMSSSTARDPRGIAQLALGHVNLATTGVYTQPGREEVESVLAEIDSHAARRRITTAQLRRAWEGRA